VEIRTLGEGESFDADPVFAEEVEKIAEKTGIYRRVDRYRPMGASEDCTLFLRRVTELGGKAAYLMFGSDLKAVHHNPKFDFDESVLAESAALLAVLAERYTQG
jgi:aminobenzoyl-glutamate utilization protein A